MSTTMGTERGRLLEAMLVELVEKGYPGVEVESAIKRADLNGSEWSVRFPDKDVCLIAAFDDLTEQLRHSICEGCAVGVEWPSRVASGLTALLARLAGRAEMAEALARVFPSIGPDAQAHYQAFVESLAPMLAAGREFSGMGEQLPGGVEMLAVGAAEAIVFEQIQAGRTAALAALAPEILFSVLVPFIGGAAAAAEMEKARAAEGDGELEVA